MKSSTKKSTKKIIKTSDAYGCDLRVSEKAVERVQSALRQFGQPASRQDALKWFEEQVVCPADPDKVFEWLAHGFTDPGRVANLDCSIGVALEPATLCRAIAIAATRGACPHDSELVAESITFARNAKLGSLQPSDVRLRGPGHPSACKRYTELLRRADVQKSGVVGGRGGGANAGSSALTMSS